MHTKERLKISEMVGTGNTFNQILQAESGRVIAFVAHHPGQHPKEEAIAQEQADAERLVEAWNKVETIQALVAAVEGALGVGQIVGLSKRGVQQALDALKGGK